MIAACCAVNHEYTDEGILHHDTTLAAKNITLAQARTSQAAHGVSVIEVRKVGNAWSVVRPSIYGRRITVNTPMEIRGPAAGHDADEDRRRQHWHPGVWAPPTTAPPVTPPGTPS